MRSYRLKAKAKLGAEVNVARVLQSFRASDVHSTELKQVVTDAPAAEPEVQKTEASVNSRKKLKTDASAPDYEMRCLLNAGERLKSAMWKGRSDDSNKFAVAYVEGSEVRMSLVDHWYKFTRAAEYGVVQRGSPVEVGREEKRKKRKRADDASGSEQGEEMDFVEEFEDDDEEQVIQTSVRSSRLNASGKALKRALTATADDSVSSDNSSIGLEDSSDDDHVPKKKTLTKQLFCKEMERLGKVKKRELVSKIAAKFDLRTHDSQRKLGDYMVKYTDEFTEGTDTVIVLKNDVRVTRRR